MSYVGVVAFHEVGGLGEFLGRESLWAFEGVAELGDGRVELAVYGCSPDVVAVEGESSLGFCE